MTEFLQLHLLTSYPPANLNRDDLSRPKSAVVGGTPRLRISSQCLKRTWRTSDVFRKAVGETVGTRTKNMGTRVFDRLLSADVDEKLARRIGEQIAGCFGKVKKKTLEIEQLAHFSPTEIERIDALADTLARDGREATPEELKGLLQDKCGAIDVAMFGRMLAEAAPYNVEAAVQVAHAITVHSVAVEDDYFTAVDDLPTGREDRGAAHLGEIGFGAGVFYQYICIDRDLLIENLDGSGPLAERAIEGLLRAAATVAPRGKQSSFASRAYASYILVERGAQQPRSLAVAFLEPVAGSNVLSLAIERLQDTRENLEKVYGATAREFQVMNSLTATGSLDEIIGFLRNPTPAAAEA